MMAGHKVLINGQWRAADAMGTFGAMNPGTCEPLPGDYPISSWQDCHEALQAAAEASMLLQVTPAEKIADFLEKYAENIESIAGELVDMAHAETGLPKKPRLADAELPRTTNQLRQAASAARSGSWQMATIDSKANIRSHYAGIGPVLVFGPNNFPYAFNGISGGDFAAAIAAGNPVIAKAHSAHPGTSRLFAEQALKAVQSTGLPPGTVQMLYRVSHADGEQLAADPRIGAIGYTGARTTGLKLKAAADKVGKPIYLELSSINPVVVLPGAIRERGEQIAEEFTASCLMGTGQFCTSPGLLFVLANAQTDQFLDQVRQKFEKAAVGTLLTEGVLDSLQHGVGLLRQAGAELLTGGQPGEGKGFCYSNTLLQVHAERFLAHPHELQTEMFGNATLVVICQRHEELSMALEQLEGNLTGCVYSDTQGEDDFLYNLYTPSLRCRVGRLLNDKMPTGVAVSPAMNHGGPFPATGHPGFTAVGIPASLLRFAALHCYDGVRQHRLPESLQNKNPNGSMWRSIDGVWTQADVPSN